MSRTRTWTAICLVAAMAGLGARPAAADAIWQAVNENCAGCVSARVDISPLGAPPLDSVPAFVSHSIATMVLGSEGSDGSGFDDPIGLLGLSSDFDPTSATGTLGPDDVPASLQIDSFEFSVPLRPLDDPWAVATPSGGGLYSIAEAQSVLTGTATIGGEAFPFSYTISSSPDMWFYPERRTPDGGPFAQGAVFVDLREQLFAIELGEVDGVTYEMTGSLTINETFFLYVVPEPTSAMALGFGLAGLGLAARRRRS